MEDDSMSAHERRQVEHIRGLDLEELQVEEVDDADSSSDDNDNCELGDGRSSPRGGITFNTGLVPLHNYLGEVDDTRGRLAFLDGGTILRLPIFYLEGAVLFPEATLPLCVTQRNFKASVERAMNQEDSPNTLGVVRIYKEDGTIHKSKIGTTAEIRQYRQLDDGSLNVITRGRQRFHLRKTWIDDGDAICGEIKIIEEDIPLRTPKDAFGQLSCTAFCLNRINTKFPPYTSIRSKINEGDTDSESDCMSYLTCGSDNSFTEARTRFPSIGMCTEDGSYESRDNVGDYCESSRVEKCLNDESFSSSGIEASSAEKSVREMHSVRYWASHERFPRAFWPFWVYRMYDAYYLARKATDMWKRIIGNSDADNLVSKPNDLSFYIGSKIPVSEFTRQQLLEIHGTSYRLQKEILLLEHFDIVLCKICRTLIARRSDMVVMSSDGPLNAYANAHGYVHEVMTLYNASGLMLFGSPSTEHSWFPGYAWTIASCASCGSHMGWRFTAAKKKLKPRSFWGIRSSQVAEEHL